MIEFACEGCGETICSFGMDTVPKHGFCAACAWMCEFVSDPEEWDAMRKRFRAMGVLPVRPASVRRV